MFARLPLLAALTVAAAVLAAAPALAAPPPTMTGEAVVSFFARCTTGTNGGPPSSADPCLTNPAPATVQARCDESGTSTLSYDVAGQPPSGFAIGPYPGTFTEQGTVTIGPQTGAPVPSGPEPLPGLTGSTGYKVGPVLTWQASFTIVSGTTTIKGTKRLTVPAPSNFGVCTTRDHQLVGGASDFTGYAYFANATLSYKATIITPDRTYRDHGTTNSYVRDAFARCCSSPPGGNNFTQVNQDIGTIAEGFFESSRPAPEPVGEEDCKDGGWQDFAGLDFKNQGDCVSFFATDGKNPPAG